MVKIIFTGIFIFFAAIAIAQIQTHVIGDSVRVHSNTSTAELILENSTKNVNGFLYNKGNGRTEFRKGDDYSVQTLSDSSVVVWNIANGANSVLTLKGTGRTLSISSPVTGHTYHIKIVQDSVGSRTITTWPSNSRWPNGLAPILSTAANQYDIVTFYYDGINFYGTHNLNFKEITPNVSIYASDTKSGTNSTVHSLTGVPAGALLVLTTTFETDNNSNCSVTSSPSLTWTKRADAAQSSSGDVEIWTAVYTGGGSIAVTSDWPTAGGNYQASSCYVVINQESSFGGATATGLGQGQPSVSITTTRANSILFCATSDWDAVDGTTRAYRDAAIESQYFRISGAATFYHYYKTVSAATTYTEGLTLPAGQLAGTAVIEIRGN